VATRLREESDAHLEVDVFDGSLFVSEPSF
jgi:hypothetical protein